MSGCDCHIEVNHREQRGVLVLLLLINAVMFVIEFVLGILADSAGLTADALDMLADAGVYGISLYAIAHSAAAKIKAALFAGLVEVVLALGVAGSVLQRLLFGSEPHSLLMMAVSALALLANIACLLLIARHRDGGMHMRASWIFSKNDVIANLGVILAGALVAWSGSSVPDLVIGAVITLVVLRGGVQILREARLEGRRGEAL